MVKGEGFKKIVGGKVVSATFDPILETIIIEVEKENSKYWVSAKEPTLIILK